MKEQEILEYFEQRFGISKKVFEGFRLYSDQKGRVLLGPNRPAADDIAVSIGIQIAKIMHDMKPSTNFLQLFGKHVKKNFVPLKREQAQAYIRGEDVALNAVPPGTEDGYVLVKYLEFSLGCGFLKGKELRNVLPKERRMKAEFL